LQEAISSRFPAFQFIQHLLEFLVGLQLKLPLEFNGVERHDLFKFPHQLESFQNLPIHNPLMCKLEAVSQVDHREMVVLNQPAKSTGFHSPREEQFVSIHHCTQYLCGWLASQFRGSVAVAAFNPGFRRMDRHALPTEELS
jgi:hypothetical protein